MRITVLNSGSSANGYVIQNEQEAVVLECGCSLTEAQKALGFNTAKVAGVFVTHEHGDHSRYVAKYAALMPVFMTAGTADSLRMKGQYNIHVIERKKQFQLGNFKILPFATIHDAKEPCGFIIQHPEMGVLMFATDTRDIGYTFKDMDYIMLECNYDDRLLNENIKAGRLNYNVGDRIKNSHMSIARCVKILKDNDLTKVKGIMLLHLSHDNSNRDNFIARVKRNTGKFVVAAEKGLEMEFLI